VNREPISPSDHVDRLFAALSNGGALLVVRGPDQRANPMTIGWGTIGQIWGRPMFLVLVRPSRYTFGLIEKADHFTVNVPDGDMERELEYCGTRSGRDGDKISACGLTALDGVTPGTTVIAQARYFYECRIVHKNDIVPGGFPDEIARHYYSGGDYHRVYFGEIVQAYRRV